MCCVTKTVAGKLPGNERRIVSKARGPPVDAPIATAFIAGCLANEGLTAMAGRATGNGATCTRKLAATAAFSNSSLRSSAWPSGMGQRRRNWDSGN
ncbi:hypothetical protein [Candidatus Hakubella thermalkaliphila]|uniref:hypothetical protein n=1 Tax=Candidatus Hakubella thermalkaliphila TaxID=2754717 RepID=UPI001592D7C7|nr:hypothetical protein [Candidatus Hakubella thermalkaliphila]